MPALFAVGIALLRRVPTQVRLFYYYLRGGGHEYDCSGRDDILLNHKHYINFLFGSVLILVLGQP